MKRLLVYAFLVGHLAGCSDPAPTEPTVLVEMQNNNCLAPCEVTFQTQAKNATGYAWDFGDGGKSAEPSPRYVFTKPGTYPVRLIVRGDGGTTTWNGPVKIRSFESQWDKTFGGSDQEELVSMTVAPNGDLILVGTSNSKASGNKSSSNYGSSDYWIVRINTKGEKLWEDYHGGQDADKPSAVLPTPDGAFLVVGTSFSSNNIGNRQSYKYGTSDTWLVKFDAGGKKLWDQAYLNGSGETCTEAANTLDGGFLLGGYTSNYDYLVRKITSNGQLVWEKTYGGFRSTPYLDGIDMVASIIATPDGGFLVGGTSSSFKEEKKKEAEYYGKDDYWIIRLNAAGDKLWEKSFGGSEKETLSKIVAVADGSFLLCGTSNSPASGNKSTPALGGADYWVVKIDAAGNKLWEKSYGDINSDVLTTAVAEKDGGFTLGGYSNSGISSTKTAPFYGVTDYWIVRISATGEKLWEQSLGGSGTDVLTAIQPSPDGGLFVGGYSNSAASTSKSASPFGVGDYWILKLN